MFSYDQLMESTEKRVVIEDAEYEAVRYPYFYNIFFFRLVILCGSCTLGFHSERYFSEILYVVTTK